MADTRKNAGKGPARLPSQGHRQKILEAAIGLFSQAATSKELAQAASINEAIIFRHFHSKDELYAAIFIVIPETPPVNNWLTELMYPLLATGLFEDDSYQASDKSVIENFSKLLLDDLRRSTP